MTEAILAFTAKKFRNRNWLILHGVLQFCGVFLISIAFLAVYKHKTNNNSNHFHSPHASMGLNTYIMLAGVTVGGIASHFSSTFKTGIKPTYLKIIHSIFAVITYFMAIFTVYLGLDSVWFRAQSSVHWIITLTYAVVTLAVLSLYKLLTH